MKRLGRDPGQEEVLGLLDSFARRERLSLANTAADDKFVEHLASSIKAVRASPILVQGRRTEKMFGFVAASLGRCLAVKQLDVGEFFASSEEVQPPDYQLALKDRRPLYVEVKNCHKQRGLFTIKESYLNRLQAYCRLFSGDLLLAVYWSQWNKWTLIAPDRLPLNDGVRSIDLGESMKINQMADLGDMFVGTRPPLVFRIIADPAKPRSIDSAGRVGFTIAGIELLCGGQRIETPKEKSLAYYFMLFGGWRSTEPEAKVENSELVSIDFVSEPEERAKPDQGFELLDPLSSMVSTRFRASTSDDEGIKSLLPDGATVALGISIPDGYKGVHLPLWRFVLQPNPAPVKVRTEPSATRKS